MSEASVNGTTLYYEEQGEGMPLLFIHGMAGNANTWHDQMRRLGGRFHTVAYDRRGHTRSPLGDVAERTVQLHADDAAGLIRALNLAPALVVGSSGGGRIAFDLVRRYPALVAAAVFSEPVLFALDPVGTRAMLSELQPAVEAAAAAGGPCAAVDAFFEYMCPGLWSRISEVQRQPYRDNHVELFGDLGMPTYAVTVEDLAQIDRPCLVIRGDQSLPVLRNIARIVGEGIPGARGIEFAGSGHVTYFEKPAEFAAAVADFARSLGLIQEQRVA